MKKITAEEIESQQTEKGGWTKSTLEKWGVPWPPPKGWKANLIKNGVPYTAVSPWPEGDWNYPLWKLQATPVSKPVFVDQTQNRTLLETSVPGLYRRVFPQTEEELIANSHADPEV